jgi:hypothetical protein
MAEDRSWDVFSGERRSCCHADCSGRLGECKASDASANAETSSLRSMGASRIFWRLAEAADIIVISADRLVMVMVSIMEFFDINLYSGRVGVVRVPLPKYMIQVHGTKAPSIFF